MVGEICTYPPFIGICKFLYEQVGGPFAPNSFYTVKYQLPHVNEQMAMHLPNQFAIMSISHVYLQEFFKDFVSIVPNGISYLQLIHYGQIMMSGQWKIN